MDTPAKLDYTQEELWECDSLLALLAEHILEELIGCSLWSSRARSSDSSPGSEGGEGLQLEKTNQSINNE